jgi:hypothetical protein
MVPPQVVGESEADGVDRRGIERRLAGNAANAVGAKEFLHLWVSTQKSTSAAKAALQTSRLRHG